MFGRPQARRPDVCRSAAIGGLYDGATTKELDALAIQTSALLIGEEPEYSFLAARLLAEFIQEEVREQGITTFSQGIFKGQELGIIWVTRSQPLSLPIASSSTPRSSRA